MCEQLDIFSFLKTQKTIEQKESVKKNELGEKLTNEGKVIRYKVWSKDKKSHIWSFINFQQETGARLIDYDHKKPPVASEIVVIYEVDTEIKQEIFRKYGLDYEIEI